MNEWKTEDPWSPQPPVRTAASANDPWSPAGAAAAAGSSEVDDFDLLTNRTQAASPLGRSNGASSPFDLSGMDSALMGGSQHNDHGGAKPKKSPESFLGPNSNLVNLENLVKSYHVIMRRSFFVFRLSVCPLLFSYFISFISNFHFFLSIFLGMMMMRIIFLSTYRYFWLFFLIYSGADQTHRGSCR